MSLAELIVFPEKNPKKSFAEFSERPGVVVHDGRHQHPHAVPTRWLAFDALTAVRRLKEEDVRRSLGGLVVLKPPLADQLTLLGAYFDKVVSPPFWRMLASNELLDAITADNADERFISGIYDAEGKRLVLYRGNYKPLTVPLSWFRSRPGGPKPDPTRLAFSDWGHTVQLGAFEAAADALLYDFDPEIRKRIKARELGVDKSFGGALRRLRLLRGLSRAEFSPEVSERTLARIESGDVGKPQRKKLELIAKKLGVQAEEIETY